MTDIKVQNHGSIVLLTPRTDAAEEWFDEHLPADAQTWGLNSIVVEPRYVGAIIEGAAEAGLEIEI